MGLHGCRWQRWLFLITCISRAQEEAIFMILMLCYCLKHSLSGKEEVREARIARMGESGSFYANIINIYNISEIVNIQKTVQTEQEELSRGQSSTLLAVTSDEESAKVRGIRARNRLEQISLIMLNIRLPKIFIKKAGVLGHEVLRGREEIKFRSRLYTEIPKQVSNHI